MNFVNRALLPLLVFNSIISSAALYFSVARYIENRAPSAPEPAQAPNGMGAVPTDGLSLRFRHPELFESAHDMARPSALGELVRRRVLRPGLSDREAAFLLGDVEDFATDENDDNSFTWRYGLPGGNLVLEFSPEHKLLRAFHAHDGDPDYARDEQLF